MKFHVVVVQRRQRNVPKSVMHAHSVCFANQTYCFFAVLVAVAIVSLVAEHLLNNIYPAAHYCITLEISFGRTEVYKNGERLHTLDCYLKVYFCP